MGNKKITLIDGAIGTYLTKKGYKGLTPELACIERDDLVEEIHTEYVESGAEIILTNTFGANKARLSKKKLEDKHQIINEKSIEIATKVKNKKNILVAGDIGPTGELLYPYGNIKQEECEEIFLSQAKFFIGKVDIIVLETFTDLSELEIAYSILKKNFQITIIPCLSFQIGKEYRTVMGNTIEDYISWTRNIEVKIIGINCGVGSEQMKEIVKKIYSLTEKSLWVKPNAGIPKLLHGEVIYPENKEEFVENCLFMCKNFPVEFIGGCCGTDPSYIKHLKEKINEYN
ncbi:MAG TPA: homocysteine S-methyltransferase family protein [bacterium]|nr:homocysteine S-methyltransferase family protein [bacterium]